VQCLSPECYLLGLLITTAESTAEKLLVAQLFKNLTTFHGQIPVPCSQDYGGVPDHLPVYKITPVFPITSLFTRLRRCSQSPPCLQVYGGVPDHLPVYKITAVFPITSHTTNLFFLIVSTPGFSKRCLSSGFNSRPLVALFHLSHSTIPLILTTLDLAILMTYA
jgi:hypothetical protein